MIDSHSHIYCDAFDEDRDAVVQRAREAGVSHIVLPGENLASVPLQVALHERYSDYISLALGLHPEEVNGDYMSELEQLRPLLDQHHVVAVGEIGIDLYWDKTWREQQHHALDIQLHWCNELGVPFIIHCRDGLDDILDVMDNLDCPVPQGVFHCFAGTEADVERIRKRGDFYFGVNGVVTFKKSTVSQVLPAIGLNRLLLETDAPYLAPVPYRGKRNESAYIPVIAAKIAELRNISLDEVAQVTTASAKSLFRLD